MKASIYCRVGNIQQTIRPNCILYLYSKNGDDLRKQEKDLISKLDMLYQDKFNGIVSEEMYLRISRETENSLIKTREKIQNLQDTKEEKKDI